MDLKQIYKKKHDRYYSEFCKIADSNSLVYCSVLVISNPYDLLLVEDNQIKHGDWVIPLKDIRGIRYGCMKEEALMLNAFKNPVLGGYRYKPQFGVFNIEILYESGSHTVSAVLTPDEMQKLSEKWTDLPQEVFALLDPCFSILIPYLLEQYIKRIESGGYVKIGKVELCQQGVMFQTGMLWKKKENRLDFADIKVSERYMGKWDEDIMASDAIIQSVFDEKIFVCIPSSAWNRVILPNIIKHFKGQ